MKKNSFKFIVSILLVSVATLQVAFAAKHINDRDLWKHVVTVDRLAWQEREGIKKINKQVDDESFVRRIYLDITGKIPTYEQMLAFRKSKDIAKRQKLIEQLLSTPGYVSYYTNFWQDLLRNPGRDPEDHNHREFTRFIEKFLHENWKYDKIVKTMMMAEGKVQENQAIGFYMRDEATDPMDTLNATVRAFLGTRIGCAQCHNHRFDKWTQKEFYESAAHLWGTNCGSVMGNGEEEVQGTHWKAFMKDSRYTSGPKHSNYLRRLSSPSVARVSFNYSQHLKYPDNYVYDNAKPLETVKERIVFGYGDEKVEGENRRERFANWMTSKNNPMFAKIMANRLWKRIMGVSLLEPIDDWKDNIEVGNEHLFHALGDIFVATDYDFKAFLSVIFNSEAYQYAIDTKNQFSQEDYKVQGATLKRMSAFQLNDSLLTLLHGDLDRHAKLNDQYFEFEQKLNELTAQYLDDLKPMFRAHSREYGRDTEEINPAIIEKLAGYMEKYRELEDYYQVQPNGYIADGGAAKKAIARGNTAKEEDNKMMGNQGGSNMQGSNANGRARMVQRASYTPSDFMNVFGMNDRSSPETNVETGATMKQILKMMNSAECKKVTGKDSYLMKGVWEREKLTERISYLYYSIYGRAPTKKDLNIAASFFQKGDKQDRWAKYTLALLNSPEFYFIK